MRKYSIGDARKKLAKVLSEVMIDGMVQLEKHGRPTALVIPLDYNGRVTFDTLDKLAKIYLEDTKEKGNSDHASNTV